MDLENHFEILEPCKSKAMREIKFRTRDSESKKILGYIMFPMLFADIFTTSKLLSSNLMEQYTGLKDKDGKEIYEGDIVEQIFHGVENESTLIEVKDIRHLSELYIGSTKSNKVIGNIYENPELLK